jgi:hypothetical protein
LDFDFCFLLSRFVSNFELRISDFDSEGRRTNDGNLTICSDSQRQPERAGAILPGIFAVERSWQLADGRSIVVSIDSRPVTRPYAEFRFRDPEGNASISHRAKAGKWM